MTLLASRAILESWVINITVFPVVVFSSFNNFIIFDPVFESRFPVGSSAKITSGLFDKDLAIARARLTENKKRKHQSVLKN